MERDKDTIISQEDYQQYDLYAYTDWKQQGDVQGIVNTLCDAHRSEVCALHKMYGELLSELKHKLARAEHEASALQIAIDRHNQRMMGNKVQGD